MLQVPRPNFSGPMELAHAHIPSHVRKNTIEPTKTGPTSFRYLHSLQIDIYIYMMIIYIYATPGLCPSPVVIAGPGKTQAFAVYIHIYIYIIFRLYYKICIFGSNNVIAWGLLHPKAGHDFLLYTHLESADALPKRADFRGRSEPHRLGWLGWTVESVERCSKPRSLHDFRWLLTNSWYSRNPWTGNPVLHQAV